MTDKELIELLRRMSPRLDMLDCENVLTAADRIETLIAERDQHWDSFVFWRAEADGRTEQLKISEAKLAKAVEALECVKDYIEDASRGQLLYRGKSDISKMAGDDLIFTQTTLAEIKGESHE